MVTEVDAVKDFGGYRHICVPVTSSVKTGPEYRKLE